MVSTSISDAQSTTIAPSSPRLSQAVSDIESLKECLVPLSGSVSSETTVVGRLWGKHPTSSLHDKQSPYSLYEIAKTASLIPLSSVVTLILTLIGHGFFLALGYDKSQTIAATAAAGTVGGAVWAGAALAFVGLLHLMLKPDHQGLIGIVRGLCIVLTVIVAPPLGVTIMAGIFHGQITDTSRATLGSIIAVALLFLAGLLVSTLFMWTEKCIPLNESSRLGQMRARVVASAQEEE